VKRKKRRWKNKRRKIRCEEGGGMEIQGRADKIERERRAG
jgi:hypothetical protein